MFIQSNGMKNSYHHHDEVQVYQSRLHTRESIRGKCAPIVAYSKRTHLISDFISFYLVMSLLTQANAFPGVSIAVPGKEIAHIGYFLRMPVTTAVTGTSFNMNSENEGDEGSKTTLEQKPTKPILSRPERKALERANKEKIGQRSKRMIATNNIQQHISISTPSNNSNKRRKHNYEKRLDHLQNVTDAQRYGLHSTILPELCTNESTPNDLMRAIKRAQNLHDVHDLRSIMRFLGEQTDTSFAYGYRGSLLARLSVAAMHLGQPELANEALQLRRTEHFESIVPLESAAIIRGLLRLHDVPNALKILNDELPLPTKDEIISAKQLMDVDASQAIFLQDVIRYRSLSVASIVSRHFFEDETEMALNACDNLVPLGSLVSISDVDDLLMPWSRLLQGAAQCQSRIRDGTVPVQSSSNKLPCNLVYAVLNAMTTFPSINDDRIFEIIANSLVRRVVFVAGAVNMDGLPKADRGEAAFIGRSNVGKSSLVNMVTNRKSLAYTSKRPGKTQQINFFAVNDKIGREKEIRYGDVLPGEKDDDSFYIVDLPGFGYAKVPEQQRKQWSNFMHEYLSQRKTLRVVFHLIDSRLGPTEDDAATMKVVREYLPNNVAYIIVLTKADKNVKGAASQYYRGKVSATIMNNLQEVKGKNGLRSAPVILSSAETKLGRDEIWKYLRLAAET